jgi:hypothetical protein
VREDRKRFDWFVGYLETRWYNADGPSQWTADAYMSQQISSSKWAADNTESATGSFTSNRECGTPFTVSAASTAPASRRPSSCVTTTACAAARSRPAAPCGTPPRWARSTGSRRSSCRRCGTDPPARKFKFWVEIPRYTYEHNGAIWIRNTKYKWIGRNI